MGSLECSHLCSILKNEVAFRLARGVPEVRSVYNEGTNEGILRTELITRPPPFLQRASKTAMEFSFPLGEAERRRPTKMGIADAWLIAMSPCLCPPKTARAARASSESPGRSCSSSPRSFTRNGTAPASTTLRALSLKMDKLKSAETASRFPSGFLSAADLPVPEWRLVSRL